MSNQIYVLVFALVFISQGWLMAQDDIFIISPQDMEAEFQSFSFPNTTEWKFKEGNNPEWANADFDDSDWIQLDSLNLINLNKDSSRIEGWFRFKIKLSKDFKDIPNHISSRSLAAQEIYINGELVTKFGNTGLENEAWKAHRALNSYPTQISLERDSIYVVCIHFVDQWNSDFNIFFEPYQSFRQDSSLFLQTKEGAAGFKEYYDNFVYMLGLAMGMDLLLAIFFWGLSLLNRGKKELIYSAIISTALFLFALALLMQKNLEGWEYYAFINGIIVRTAFTSLIIGMLFGIAQIFAGTIPKWIKVMAVLTVIMVLTPYSFLPAITMVIVLVIAFVLPLLILIIKNRKNIRGPKRFVLAGIILTFLLFSLPSFLSEGFKSANTQLIFFALLFITFPICLLLYIAFWLRNSVNQERERAAELVKVSEEKKDLLEQQNLVLEEKVSERTKELEQSLNNLKATQDQLIQSEKMASLGELTAGIAHEIKNPLNFVNNFSELNKELISEIKEELINKNYEEVDIILKDIEDNSEKINHHGHRADSIVKGMLQHSRASGDKKEETDINQLADEYLKLAYHGLRAKDQSFNATLETNYDPQVGKVAIIPQDIGRVMLNLLTNGFYAIQQKAKGTSEDYQPTVGITTKKEKAKVLIEVSDNGGGIPSNIQEKIFQPFYTTKPTGEGTGLGLSLSYDIVTKGHNGQLIVKSLEGKGTTFTIKLPTDQS